MGREWATDDHHVDMQAGVFEEIVHLHWESAITTSDNPKVKPIS